MVLLTRLDNRQTHVVNRRTGVFRRADQQLEARARQYAEQSIRSESVRRGILQTAEVNAQARVAELARALGARRVVFERPTFKGEGRRMKGEGEMSSLRPY
jgi:hypothetical protein